MNAVIKGVGAGKYRMEDHELYASDTTQKLTLIDIIKVKVRKKQIL